MHKLFPFGHATHPQWAMAAGLVVAQLRAQMALPTYASAPSLGIVYITDHYAKDALAILEYLTAQLPLATDWAGTVGVGIAANNVEYFDEPALAVMLCDVAGDQYRVFSGVAPLNAASGFRAHTALVHADGQTPDMPDLLEEMAARTASGYLFGGLAASRAQSVQFAVSSDHALRGQGHSSGVFHGGMSGVAFSSEVAMLSRVTQGCQPILVNGRAKSRTITEADRNLVLRLDGESALDVLLADLDISLDKPHEALTAVRATLVGLANPEEMALNAMGHFGQDVRVRHIIGLDPNRRGIAIADLAPVGASMSFCQRSMPAAKADLTRICSEIRESLEPAEMEFEAATQYAANNDHLAVTLPQFSEKNILGAIYVSCAGRGGPHFGAPSAELQTIRRALGDVPLVGFFAGGEIAHKHLYGYTGVLTVFTG